MIYPKYIVNLQHNVCGSVLWMILCLTTYFLLSVNACRLASPEASERYFGPCDQCQQKWTTMVLKLCPFGVSKRAVRLTLFSLYLLFSYFFRIILLLCTIFKYIQFLRTFCSLLDVYSATTNHGTVDGQFVA